MVIYVPDFLHGANFQPERRWAHLDPETMAQVFAVNTFGVALCIKHCLSLLPKRSPAWFASISARVGSIGDNRLGGWYSYRASKAAQNMLIKTAAIEAGRLRPELACVALHPGTVDTDLSKPFSARVAPHKLFTPKDSAAKLCRVLSGLTGKETGRFYAWDGSPVDW